MPEMQYVRQMLEQLDSKLDRMLAIEARVAVLETRVEHHDSIEREVIGLRDLLSLRDKSLALEAIVRVLGLKVDELEKQSHRRDGITDGVKLAWLVISGAPGVVAIVMQYIKN